MEPPLSPWVRRNQPPVRCIPDDCGRRSEQSLLAPVGVHEPDLTRHEHDRGPVGETAGWISKRGMLVSACLSWPLQETT
jgi:hypothetical protein